MQSIIGQIGIFMICAQTIMHFRPKEVYGKYLRLLFSVMILIQILQPFANFFMGGTGVDLQKSVELFQKNLEESMEESKKKAAESEEQLKQMSLEEVQERQMLQESQEAQGERTQEEDRTLQENRLSKENEDGTIKIERIEEIQITREEE